MNKKTRYVILGLLRDVHMSGYDIKNCISARMSFFWQESYGQIYPELNSMLEEGLIEEWKETKPCDKRGKTQYSITPHGKEVFNVWMAAANEKDTVRSEALLKFFLADDINKADIRKHLTNFYQQNNERLEMLLKIAEDMKQYTDLHNNHIYIAKMLELGIKQQEVVCDWSKQYLDELKD